MLFFYASLSANSSGGAHGDSDRGRGRGHDGVSNGHARVHRNRHRRVVTGRRSRVQPVAGGDTRAPDNIQRVRGGDTPAPDNIQRVRGGDNRYRVRWSRPSPRR